MSQPLALPETVYVVTRLHTWAMANQGGKPLIPSKDPDQPIGFLPVFADRKMAEDWAGDPSLVIPMTSTKQ